MNRLPPPQRLHAVTFLELLLVIGGLALLAALLFPVFQKARTQSHMARCANNLRQISSAAALYSGEHNGEWPATQVGDGGLTFADSLASYLGPYPPKTSVGWRDSVLICPADRYSPGNEMNGRWEKEGVYTPGSPQHGLSYAENLYLVSDQASYRSGPRPAVVNLHRLATFMDWEGHYAASYQTLTASGGTRKEALAKRHYGSINVVFGDGHITPIRVDDIPQVTPPPIPFWTGRGK